ncbi:hypothetical protein CEXT_182971 [Caerostris extrusa]|uniref:Uncharacterized protein n=1 Tax=Caerostris extrusa TaxID=172846 RepID=A0AAV4RXL5_CAEEX|nr:hypothetical protein CEXT_182971 [Caerostris extrusa]
MTEDDIVVPRRLQKSECPESKEQLEQTRRVVVLLKHCNPPSILQSIFLQKNPLRPQRKMAECSGTDPGPPERMSPARRHRQQTSSGAVPCLHGVLHTYLWGISNNKNFLGKIPKSC